jgi:hypothetical protein
MSAWWERFASVQCCCVTKQAERVWLPSLRCIEAFGGIHAAENAPLVRRINSAQAAMYPCADPSTSGSREILCVLLVADSPDEKCWSSPPIDRREARRLGQLPTPVKSDFNAALRLLIACFRGLIDDSTVTPNLQKEDWQITTAALHFLPAAQTGRRKVPAPRAAHSLC